ncbi:uncharacterized protein LOC116430148 [Nomia melanderi]|uniref:uncharacterized protein LOC116430148 n=1 Tax=Nomia melanderi TaxID=2448451 RepID=UPI003FCD7461
MINATAGGKVTYDDLVEGTINIFRSCITFDRSNAFLLAGEYDDFLRRSSLEDTPLALIAESKFSAFDLFASSRYSYTVFKRHNFVHLLWKLNQFAVIASSQPLLRQLLQRIKDSTWSNFNGFHVLIDRRTEERGCADAYRFLWTAWEYDLINSIFLCVDPAEGIVVYAYDPFSGRAPDGWQAAGYFKGRSGHPWVLLKRKYQDGMQMCENLWFDKTKDLNGYEVRMHAIAYEPHLKIDLDKPGLDKFTGDNSEIVKIVFDKLNATLNVAVHNGSEAYELGGIGSDGTMVGMLADVASGQVDMGMNVRTLHAIWRIGNTYPHGQDGLCVITRRSGHISEYIKILSFISPEVIIGNIVVFVITLLVLAKYQGFQSASLNVIRLLTCVSMLRMPHHTAYRILLSNVLLLILIVNTLLQSHWASLLTAPVSLPNIRTAEDLKASNYKIYGSWYYAECIHDPKLRARYHGVDNYRECKEQVLRTPSTACLDDCLHLYVGLDTKRFYRSRWIQHSVQVYPTRENWPLFNRVSYLIRGTVEAGLVRMWKKASLRQIYLNWKRRQLDDNKKFRTVELKHITFGFYILGVGNTSAALVFLVELAIGAYRQCRG